MIGARRRLWRRAVSFSFGQRGGGGHHSPLVTTTPALSIAVRALRCTKLRCSLRGAHGSATRARHSPIEYGDDKYSTVSGQWYVKNVFPHSPIHAHVCSRMSRSCRRTMVQHTTDPVQDGRKVGTSEHHDGRPGHPTCADRTRGAPAPTTRRYYSGRAERCSRAAGGATRKCRPRRSGSVPAAYVRRASGGRSVIGTSQGPDA